MKKKLTAIALIVALLAVAVIGGTLAYFTDTDSAKNTFTMGKVDISLDEAPVDKNGKEIDGDRVQKNDYEHLYPGQIVDKDPTVHNDGDYDAYVRVKVAFPVVSNNAQADFANVGLLIGNEAGEDYVFGNLSTYNLPAVFGGLDLDKWTVEQTAYTMPFFGTPGTILELTFTYKEILHAGEDAVLFETVTINPEIEGEFNVTMDITAEAVQADGFDSAAKAFAATFDA